MIPGRGGAIEWFCDGVDCHACRMPGVFALAAFTARRRRHGPLLAIPGVVRHQRGDDELRAVFVPTPETLAAVAAIIRPRRRRSSVATPARLAALARGRQARAESGHREALRGPAAPPGGQARPGGPRLCGGRHSRDGGRGVAKGDNAMRNDRAEDDTRPTDAAMSYPDRVLYEAQVSATRGLDLDRLEGGMTDGCEAVAWRQ